MNVVFPESAIAVRFKDMLFIMDRFCASYNKNADLKAEIDTSLLYLVVVAMYDDIARYKAYHLTDPERQRANAIKRAAYAARWITQFNPLIFPGAGHHTNVEKKSHDCLINALFSVHFAMLNIKQYKGVRFRLSNDLLYGMLYDLLYRNVGGDSFILVLDVLAKVAEGGAVLENLRPASS